MDNNFVTLQEASRMMDKSVQTLRRMVKKGELQAQRVKTPQGFQYIVSREDLAAMGYVEQNEMFSESTIQTPIQQAIEVQKEAEKTDPPIQKKVLTSQTPKVVQKKAKKEPIDIQAQKNVAKYENELKALYAIIAAYHQEKMAMIDILNKMQEELIEKPTPKPTFWERLADKFR